MEILVGLAVLLALASALLWWVRRRDNPAHRSAGQPVRHQPGIPMGGRPDSDLPGGM